ncbi:MAG: hypothetical protein II875_13920 [Clostridia bacterium]|nr:hypothetical protein [Clostridia bacterium]
MKKRLFAGYDGGGSKTVCALYDETGRLLGTGSGGASNYRYCGEETAAQSMIDALDGAFRDAGLQKEKLALAYISNATIPTYGGDEYVPFFEGCVDAEKVVCEGDLYPIWYGATRLAPAVVCIVGTGSVAYLFRQQKTVRAGGWGPQIGDEGSGYDIGASAMRLVMKMYDGRAARDEAFYQAMLGHFEVSDPRRFIAVAHGEDGRKRVASAAKVVCALADGGNACAGGLLDDAAEEVVLLVRAVLARDEESDRVPLILSGGLTSEGSALRSRIERLALEKCARVSAVKTPAVSAAAACASLALKLAGLDEAAEKALEA